jgi:hypothetical protein
MIWIEVLDIPWEPGKRLKLRKYRNFEYWLAQRFVKETVKAINAQIYLSKWPPLARGYLEKKRQEGLSTKIWEATSELKNSLKVKKSRRITIGFDGRRHHKSSKEKLADIAKRVEFGSSVMRIPPRPLFREVFRWMNANLGKYYLLYLKEGGK